jgi:single-strand DNA-binding protein
MSINKVVITGNLTRDPELRATPSGMSVLSIGVAVNDRRKNSSTGEWEEFPNFLDCVTFGSRADGLAKVLTKGAKVAIEGKLRWSQWETKEGQKRSKVEILIDDLEFFSSRSNTGGGSDYNAGSTQHAAGSASASVTDAQIPAAPEVTVYDDDIPF